jgi:hypothetical protein
MDDRVKFCYGILNSSRVANYSDKNYEIYRKKGRGVIENLITSTINPYT